MSLIRILALLLTCMLAAICGRALGTAYGMLGLLFALPSGLLMGIGHSALMDILGL